MSREGHNMGRNHQRTSSASVPYGTGYVETGYKFVVCAFFSVLSHHRVRCRFTADLTEMHPGLSIVFLAEKFG